jgi:hypothetical protein
MTAPRRDLHFIIIITNRPNQQQRDRHHYRQQQYFMIAMIPPYTMPRAAEEGVLGKIFWPGARIASGS